MAMTSRQRVLAALNHQEADRVPLDFGGRITTLHAYAERALKEYLGLAGGEQVIVSTMTYTVEPDPRLLAMFGRDTIPLRPNAEAGYVFNLDPVTNTYVDEWGIKYRMPPDGYYFDPCEYPLATAETVADVERFRFPNPTDPNRLAGVAEQIAAAHRAGEKAILLAAPHFGLWILPFYLRGLEQGMMDLALNPTLAEALAERVTEWYVEFWDWALSRVGQQIDIVHMEGDLGHQNGPLFSPRVFRQIYKPRLRRVVDAIKRRSAAKVFLHSCGSVYWAIPDLIEVGIEILNPVQVNAAEMDTARLKREFGRDLTFWGGGCDPVLLQNGTPAEVTAEVKRRIDDLAPGGGYVFGSVHNIQANVPPQNIVAMFQTAREYGVYKR